MSLYLAQIFGARFEPGNHKNTYTRRQHMGKSLTDFLDFSKCLVQKKKQLLLLLEPLIFLLHMNY